MPVVRVVTHRAVLGALVSEEHKIAFSAAFLVLVKQEYIWVDIRVSEPLPGEVHLHRSGEVSRRRNALTLPQLKKLFI